MKTSLLPFLIDVDGFPITLAFSFDKRVFFSERITGNLWEVKKENFRLVKNFPIVPITGHHETGLLGIALDPDFAKNDYIYCYFSYGPDENNIKNKVVKIKSNGADEEVILNNIPGGRIHNGGIIAFAPDGTLYIGVGVKNEEMGKSQDIKYLDGKVLRINRDGSIPSDNPFPNSPVYSYGHRNLFGFAVHPKTGKFYVSEAGPDRNDEINIIEKGGNYGWPKVIGITDNPDYVNPIIAYTPTITPTQSVFVDGKLYFGSYNEGTIHRLTLSGKNFDNVEKDEVVYRGKSFGTIGVFYGPDEQFYLTTPNKILQFVPKVKE